MTGVLTPEEYAAYYAAEVGDTPAAPEAVVEVAADTPDMTEAEVPEVAETDAADEGYYEETTDGVEESAASGVGLSAIPAMLILALFLFLVWRGVVSNSGPVCGRPWLAMLALSTAAAVSFSLLRSAFAPRAQTSAYDELSKGTGFFPKVFGATGGGALAGPALAFSMVPFAIFLSFFQYLVTVFILFFQKPRAGISEILKKSLIAAGISLATSAIFIVVFLVLSNVPAFRAILTIGTKLPFIGTFIQNNSFALLASNPLAVFGGLASFGIACSAVNEPPQ